MAIAEVLAGGAQRLDPTLELDPSWPLNVVSGLPDWPRLLDLHHQVVVPLACHLDVGRGAEQEGFDQVVVEIGLEARLPTSVGHGRCAASRNEPGLSVLERRVRKGAPVPDQVAVPADQVGP